MATTITTGQTASTLPQKKGDPPNFGTVKSGRALAFDGVVDYLTLPTLKYIDWYTNGGTISLWVYLPTAISGDDRMFSHYSGNDGAQRIYFGFNSNGRLSYTLGTGANVRYSSNDVINIDTWHHTVLTWNTTTAYLYLDGVQVATNSESLSGLANLNLNGWLIGDHSDGNNTLKANMSNFKMWDKYSEIEDIQYEYTHPEMLAYTRSGTSLTESNLKVWLPMTEGNPESPQTTIFDGSPKVLGSELVSTIENHTGASPLDDFVDNGGGSYTCTHSGSGYQGFEQPSSDTFAVAIGEIYKVTFNYTTVSGANDLNIFLGSDAVGSSHSTPATFNVDEGDNTIYVQITSAYSSARFVSQIDANSVFTISNISVKKVQRGNHATSVFYGDNLYTVANAVRVNNDGTSNEVDDDEGWTFSNTSAQGSTGGESHTGTKSMFYEADDANGRMVADLNGIMTVGKTYKLTCYVRHTGSGDNQEIRFASDSEITNDVTTLATILSLVQTFNKVEHTFVYSTNYRYFGSMEVGTNNNGGIYLDSLSIKEVGIAPSGHVGGQETIFQPAFVGQSRKKVFGDQATNATFTEISLINNTASLSLWICPDNVSSKGVIIGTSTTASNIYILDSTSIQMEDEANSVTLDWTVPTMSVGNWYHLAMVFNDDAGYSLYMNGSFVSTQSDVAFNGLDINRIGGATGATDGTNFDGIIDEISYWTKELTLADVQEIYNDGVPLDLLTHSSTSDLDNYWRNNNLHTDGTWKDLKGSNNMTFTATNDYEVIFPEGTTSGRDINGFFLTHPNKNYLSLDGTDGSYVNVPHSDVFDFGTGSFTVQFWIKPHTLTDNDRIITKGTTDAGEWMISVNTDGSSNKVVRVYTKDSGGQEVDTGSETTKTLTINTWSFITVVFDRDNEDILVYKDDSLTEYNKDASDWGDSATLNNSEPITIGASDTLATGTFFDGIIDDVRIYNKVLSEPDITKNYRHGTAKHKD